VDDDVVMKDGDEGEMKDGEGFVEKAWRGKVSSNITSLM
jgi:hypothetical protein